MRTNTKIETKKCFWHFLFSHITHSSWAPWAQTHTLLGIGQNTAPVNGFGNSKVFILLSPRICSSLMNENIFACSLCSGSCDEVRKGEREYPICRVPNEFSLFNMIFCLYISRLHAHICELRSMIYNIMKMEMNTKFHLHCFIFIERECQMTNVRWQIVNIFRIFLHESVQRITFLIRAGFDWNRRTWYCRRIFDVETSVREWHHLQLQMTTSTTYYYCAFH